jgi:hypothetical protein
MLAATGCVRAVSPALTFDAYEHKAKHTAESVLSAVQAARLGADAGSNGDAFGPYVSVVLVRSGGGRGSRAFNLRQCAAGGS